MCKCAKLIFLLCLIIMPVEAVMAENLLQGFASDYKSEVREGLCFRKMEISSLNSGSLTGGAIRSQIGQKVVFSDSPFAGDGFIMVVKFSMMGQCEEDGSKYSLTVKASNGVKIFGQPANMGTRVLIESGRWSDNFWQSDLMWTFKTLPNSYKDQQWVSIDLISTKSNRKVLGGKVYIKVLKPRVVSSTTHVVRSEYKGIYLDFPNEISWLNKRYGSDFKDGEGLTSFDRFADIDIHYVVINEISEFFSESLSGKEQDELEKEAINYIHYIKRVRPDINIWFAVPSWRFEIPGDAFQKLILWINSVKEIDGMVLDWETPRSLLLDVPFIFRHVRKELDEKKKFICTPTAFIGRRGLNWNEVDSDHAGCDLFLPMFYVSQQEKLLITAKKEWLDSWRDPRNTPSSPIIPLLIPIHKVTDNTPVPASLMRDSIDLINAYEMPGFFIYRPYSVTSDMKALIAGIYGEFVVDFGLKDVHFKQVDDGSIEVRGNVVNLGTTKFPFQVAVKMIIHDGVKTIKNSFKIDLKDGFNGYFVKTIHCRDETKCTINFQLDPADKYIPRPLHLEGGSLFVIPSKLIDIPEVNEENNEYTYYIGRK